MADEKGLSRVFTLSFSGATQLPPLLTYLKIKSYHPEFSESFWVTFFTLTAFDGGDLGDRKASLMNHNQESRFTKLIYRNVQNSAKSRAVGNVKIWLFFFLGKLDDLE